MAVKKAEETERDFTLYAEKDATGTMQAFADWLIEVCDLEFPNGKAEDQFRFGVQLGGTLRMDFQASDYWRTDERNPRSPAGKKARAAANGAATRGRGKAKDDEDENGDEDEKPAKPARATRQSGATGKTSAGKATTTRRGRGSAAKPATESTRRGRGRPAAAGKEAPY
jgi:hypothetical protein